MTPPAYCRPTAYEAFACEVANLAGTRALVRAACAISAHEFPQFQAIHTLQALDTIVTTVRRRTRSTLDQAVLAHLHDVLFDVLGFRGNTTDYYAPTNSYLPHVVATREGIPITLALVYKYIADQLGLVAYGVNAPGHFLVAVELNEGTSPQVMLLDPFYGGKLLTPDESLRRMEEAIGKPVIPTPDLFAPVSHRAWLLRMLRNLQAIFAQTGREKDLYAMQEMQFLVERKGA